MKISHPLFLGIAILGALGCSKHTGNDQDAPSINFMRAQLAEFDGKTATEVLGTKYDKAVLECTFWSQNRDTINTAQTHDSNIRIDLKNGSPLPQSFNLEGHSGDHQIQLQVEVSSIRITGDEYINSENDVHRLLFSPVVHLEINENSKTNYKSKTKNVILGPSTVIGPLSGDVYEGFSATVVDDLIVPPIAPKLISNPASYRDTLQCEIKTAIKPKYQATFKAYIQGGGPIKSDIRKELGNSD